MTNKIFTTALTPELYCSNIVTSLFFYTHILGFNIQYQREESKFAMLERQGARIMLEEIPQHSNNKINRTWLAGSLEAPFGRGVNFEIKTTKIDELYVKVSNAEITIFLPLEDKWYRVNKTEIGNRQFIVLDPDGYMLRFAQSLGERNID